MKTKAAILATRGADFVLTELDLQEPRTGEVQVKMATAGLCHTDVHVQVGDMPVELPYLCGHEGAAVVEAVGPGVSRVAPGDHVVFSFIPACGHCRWCSTGHQNLCDLGAGVLAGLQLDGTTRLSTSDGTGVPQFCSLGTFSERAVVPEVSCVKIDPELSLESAALVGCGVTTGIGSALYAAKVRPGDTVVVYGLGGIGVAALQGARISGAQHIITVDPLEWKSEKAKVFGATHTATGHEEAMAIVADLTHGVLADHAILCAGLVPPELVGQGMQIIRKGGQVTYTGVTSASVSELPINGFEMLLFEKTLRGTIFGSSNPYYDIPRILSMYKSGHILLDEMITSRYALEDINQGYADLLKGDNIRGVINF